MTLPATQAALTLVRPTKGVLPIENLKNLDNWRALIHQITPVVVTVLTTLSITTEAVAGLWVSLLFAIIDPLLSYRNATDKARQIAYGVLGLLQTGGLLATILAPVPAAIPVAAAITTIVSATLSRFYTPTTTMVPKTAGGSLRPTFPGNPWPVS